MSNDSSDLNIEFAEQTPLLVSASVLPTPPESRSNHSDIEGGAASHVDQDLTAASQILDADQSEYSAALRDTPASPTDTAPSFPPLPQYLPSKDALAVPVLKKARPMSKMAAQLQTRLAMDITSIPQPIRSPVEVTEDTQIEALRPRQPGDLTVRQQRAPLGPSKVAAQLRSRLSMDVPTVRARELSGSNDGRPLRRASPEPIVAEEVEVEFVPGKFEFAFTVHVDTLLVGLLRHIDLATLTILRKLTRTMARCLEIDAKELVLQRFLGPFGYRSFSPLDASTAASQRRVLETAAASIEQRNAITTTKLREETIVLDLRDLDTFILGLRYSVSDYSKFAQAHSSPNTPPLKQNTLCMIRASTRAWNRVVMRIRSQFTPADNSMATLQTRYYFEDMSLESNQTPVYKNGRAATMRVWVPTAPSSNNWMSDEEVVECEREVWR